MHMPIYLPGRPDPHNGGYVPAIATVFGVRSAEQTCRKKKNPEIPRLNLRTRCLRMRGSV
jgi:hypothetical protein